MFVIAADCCPGAADRFCASVEPGDWSPVSGVALAGAVTLERPEFELVDDEVVGPPLALSLALPDAEFASRLSDASPLLLPPADELLLFALPR